MIQEFTDPIENGKVMDGEIRRLRAYLEHRLSITLLADVSVEILGLKPFPRFGEWELDDWSVWLGRASEYDERAKREQEAYGEVFREICKLKIFPAPE